MRGCDFLQETWPGRASGLVNLNGAHAQDAAWPCRCLGSCGSSTAILRGVGDLQGTRIIA